MAILSITFHIEETELLKWNKYLKSVLIYDLKNINKKYLLTEVESEMLSEGKNTNVLLFFDNQSDRIYFLENELPHISNKIFDKFSESVLIFNTFLNKIESNI